MLHKLTASGAPGIERDTRPVTVRAQQARAYGLPATTPTVTIEEVTGNWIEQLINDKWIIAGRLVPDDRGAPVLAELRVFPFETTRPEGFVGRWGAAVLGDKAPGVPRGGISATFIRKHVAGRIAKLERAATLHLHVAGRFYGKRTALDSDSEFRRAADRFLAEEADKLRASGFDLNRPLKQTKTRRPVGRQTTPDLLYARLAVAYGDALTANRRPVARELVRLGLAKTEPAAKSMIARARREKFLEPAPRHGSAGGGATQKALDVLAAVLRQTQPAPVQATTGAVSKDHSAKHRMRAPRARRATKLIRRKATARKRKGKARRPMQTRKGRKAR